MRHAARCIATQSIRTRLRHKRGLDICCCRTLFAISFLRVSTVLAHLQIWRGASAGLNSQPRPRGEVSVIPTPAPRRSWLGGADARWAIATLAGRVSGGGKVCSSRGCAQEASQSTPATQLPTSHKAVIQVMRLDSTPPKNTPILSQHIRADLARTR